MSFKVGDKVRTKVTRSQVPSGTVGTVTTSEVAVPGETTVTFPGIGSKWFYRASKNELELVESQYINVITSRSIWVTLPGDNAGHMLTEEQARALFRQLEEVV